MKEIPILFSTDMVQAILEGRKTQTRRLTGLEEFNKHPNQWYYRKFGGMAIGPHTAYKHQMHDGFGHGYFDPGVRSPYGKPGDILWVRESFTINGHNMGWWDSAAHLRYIIDELTRVFASVVTTMEGEMTDD